MNTILSINIGYFIGVGVVILGLLYAILLEQTYTDAKRAFKAIDETFKYAAKAKAAATEAKESLDSLKSILEDKGTKEVRK